MAVCLHAQDRFLGKEDIRLFGYGLRVEPDHQTVPKDIATIVSTMLVAPGAPTGAPPAFAPDAIVKATLRGPSVGAGLELTAKPNTPFNIPPLGVPGLHTLDEIRLESGGEVLLRGTPESVTIEVIEKLLVTQVTARPLSAQEIREKGIVFDKSSFQAYDFTAAFAIEDKPIRLSFPVLLPTLQGADTVSLPGADGGKVDPPALPELKTIIPDTLRLQTQIPNLKVVGFTLKFDKLRGNTLVVPPIPAAVIFKGDIGFLDQFFAVTLLVGNAAPTGSNLVVTDLSGEIVLPPGNDTVVGSDDDPLRMARTARGEAPRIQLITQPGPDGQAGTADDVLALGPGQSATAEYLVEGRREGTHVIEFAIKGTLTGLPVGPVEVTGRAAGSVLVRNPNFTLTFTHPEVVTAGEHYTLDVTVTNTSSSPANFVSLNLRERDIVGATVVGDPSRQVETIAPGDSATVSFDLIARITGKVTAATLDADDNVAGRFALKTSVGELGVPLSPDSLVLPSQASALPADLRSAALGLLGKAWAVATAPAAALPGDVKRFSKQIVLDHGVEVAEAGFRVSLHEPMPDSIAQLEMDFAGSNFARLSARTPNPADLAVVQADFAAFDELRRRSVRGDVFAQAVAAHLAPEVEAQGIAAFHRAFAEKVAYRPSHLSVLIGNASGPLPFTISLVDPQGRRAGRADEKGKVVKEIPFSDVLTFTDGSGAPTGQMVLLAAPEAGEYHVQFDAVPGTAADHAFDVSLVVPDGSGNLRQVVYRGVTGFSSVTSSFSASDPFRLRLDLPAASLPPTTPPVAPSSDSTVAAPGPHVISVVQEAEADVLFHSIAFLTEGDLEAASNSLQLGRIVAVLFSEEVTPQGVQDKVASHEITRYDVDGNQVVGVALQPGRRIAFLALRDPIGSFIPRQITVSGVTDAQGRAMPTQTLPIETTVTDEAGVVSGQVLNADGTPAAFASVRLFYRISLNPEIWEGISSKSADADGRYSWDYVLKNVIADRVIAVDPSTDDSRTINFTIQRDGQRLNVNVVFLGRGTLQGRTLAEDGTPLVASDVRITSLTDNSSYGATTDEGGRFAVGRIPVGNVFVEAVNVKAKAQGSVSELIPLSGATVVRDVTLFSLDFPRIVVKTGRLEGHVLRRNGTSAAADVPVVIYYTGGSQTGVLCPGGASGVECPIAVGRTDAAGAFVFDHITAGKLRATTFDQTTLEQGEARVTLPGDGVMTFNILLSQGLGTVRGTVVDANGHPVGAAQVGGGLSLTTTDDLGRFTLVDVPVGHREIVAVSDRLGAIGKAAVDLVEAGQEVGATIVLEALASIAGRVFEADGLTPAAGIKVYLFHPAETGGEEAGITVDATVTTDAQGRYSMEKLRVRADYTLSAFRSDFSDGNVRPAVLKFSNQVLKGDITFRGSGGHVRGGVFDADGTTPLRAAVGISGDRVVIAGGLVGVGFQNVANFQIVQTDLATGSFRFDGLWVGPFTLSAAGEFSPDPISFESAIPAPGATVQVNLRLQPTSQIGGTVFQPDGVTPVGRNVLVRYKSSAFKAVCADNGTLTIGNIVIPGGDCADIPQGIQEEAVITDEQGHYLLPLVNAGPFTLSAEDPATGKVAEVQGEVKPGQTADFSIRLLGKGALTIRVRGSDSTTPIPGARVEVKQIAFPRKKVVAIADASGTLVLSGGDAFSEGDVVVLATDLRNGFAGRASGKVTQDGETVTIDVFLFNASGTVYGTVFKPDGVTPVPNAEVVISNCQLRGVTFAEGCISGGPLAFAVTDGSGAYREGLIPVGPFQVEVFEAATARRGAAAGQVYRDKDEVPLNIVEAARGNVTGRVVAAGSLSPLKNWDVILMQIGPSGRYLPPLRTTTGVDGTFSFPGTTAGSFTLTVQKIDTTNRSLGRVLIDGVLTHEGERVDIPVVVNVARNRVGRVEGVVVDADGASGANAAVAVCAAGCLGLDTSTTTNTVAGPDGTFAFDGVSIGRFSIGARSQVSGNAALAQGELTFEGDVTRVTLTLVGLSQISGTVVFADGRPAPLVQLVLFGHPASGCGPMCTTFADESGRFSFPNVPARTFTVFATDPVSGLRGVTGGELTPGAPKVLRLVLEPTASVSGRVRFANGTPAPGITAELASNVFGQPPRQMFQTTGPTGEFLFEAVPIATYTLSLEDPIGPGTARSTVVVAGAVALPDITLDEGPPSVSSQTPPASAVGVPRDQAVRVTFSEPIDTATATQENITLSSASGKVLATLNVGGGDTVATVTPLGPLAAETRYTVTVQGIKDRLGKAMTAAYTASFTTVDITPPHVVDLSPAADGRGISIFTAVRVKFSEPLDPAKLRGPPIVVSKGGAPVAGRTDFAFGNTVIVFSPAAPLAETSEYQVQLAAAVDTSGNEQPQGLAYRFTTTDRTPPQVVALVAAGDGTVVEGGTTQVVAEVGTTHDVAVVDFFINDVLSFAARSAPFTLAFKATPEVGKAGDRVKVSALATDTSGNRSATPVAIEVPIVADTAPVVTISAPADGASARTGDRVAVTARVKDDLGATQLALRAQTGRPQDAATRALSPPATDRTETFAFTVPADAVPGSRILITASAIDTRGQAGSAAVGVTVVDATPPTVTITGTATGARLTPGQLVTAVVSAQDAGGIKSVAFATGGVVVGSQTRAVDPAQPSVVTSFQFRVPATAHTGDLVTLDATAADAAGNTRAASRVILALVDATPPTLQIQTATGRLEIVPGEVVNLLASADDDSGVSHIDLGGQGAFSLSDARQVSPPSNSPRLTFPITVPASVAEGAVLNLSATATDVFGNVSAPATLSLTVRSLLGVTLPPSLLIAAGETAEVTVQLTTVAPSGGLRVDLVSPSPGIAVVDPFVQFAAGEATATAHVTGVSGGNVSLSAAVKGVQRASMTVAVRGGIVRGTVWNPEFQPVAGADVTVTDGYITRTTTSEGNGEYLVEGIGAGSIPLLDFAVKVKDPATGFVGSSTGRLNVVNGYAEVNIVLVPAGSLGGAVRRPDGVTPAGAGAKVDIFDSLDLRHVLATTFTDAAGAYEFPVVTLGTYVVEASDADGNRGRSSPVSIVSNGQHVDVTVTYLGRGIVTGAVHDGVGNPVPNVPLTLTAKSVFGRAEDVRTNAQSDGTFRFQNVLVGSFTVQAHDPTSDQVGTVSGTIERDGQEVAVDVPLTSWGGLQGRVLRPDGATPVVNATVDVFVSPGASGGQTRTLFFTTTDAEGRFAFTFLPLGAYTIDVSDPPTRGMGRASGTLSVPAETATRDVTLFGQGTIVATVIDRLNNRVSGARVNVMATNGQVYDSFSVDTGADGVALLEHVLAGDFTLYASSGGRSAYFTSTLAMGQVKAATVTLEATGSIAGTVYLPDGQTPAVTAKVAACESCQKVAVAADGSYRFDGLRLIPTTVVAYDGDGRKRAIARDLPLASPGQVLTADLTLAGLGTVTGRVLNPDLSSGSGLRVTLRTLDPEFGGFHSPITDGAGFYRAERVVVGPFSISVANPALGALGEAAGTLLRDGDTVNVDVVLQRNAVTLPVTRNDGNTFPFDIQRDGSIDLGLSAFAGTNYGAPGGAALLDVVAGGTANRFTGATIGTTEAAGREVVIMQQGLAGLNVTRKILVSPSYFARYLEILTNPTTAPITVDLRIESNSRVTSAVMTSSGDDVLSVADPAHLDRWVLLSPSQDLDPFRYYGLPHVGFVFDGEGAPEHAAEATQVMYQYSWRRVTYRWNAITIAPGQSVAYLHFALQQYSRAAAQASVERLEQVPPEALESLSPDEVAAIRNFAIAPDATSSVTPLPRLDGTINGRILEADYATPVPSVLGAVRFRSGNVLFGRTYVGSGDASGAFSFGPASPVTVPVEAFTLEADHPITRVTSAAAAGSFAPGALTSATNVVFSNTAILRGVVRRHTGTIVAGASITATAPSLNATFAPSASDGAYRATAILPGAVTVRAGLHHPQSYPFYNFELVGAATVTAAAGATQTVDLTIEPTGTLSGVVRTPSGAAAVGVTVEMPDVDRVHAYIGIRTTTDSAGAYRFNDVPVGAFTVRATDPATSFPIAAPVTIVRDQTSTQDLSLRAVGSARVLVTFTTGAPAANATVEIQRSVDDRFVFAGATDATGQVTIANVPAGAFTIRAHRPGNLYSVTVDVPGRLDSQGQVVPIAAVLPPVGSVQVQVSSTAGAPVANARVDTDARYGYLQFEGRTDESGRLLITDVPGPAAFKVAAYDPVTFQYRVARGSLTGEGQVVPVTIVVGSVGAVSGRVMNLDGSVAASASVRLRSEDPPDFFDATTNAQGEYAFAAVAPGLFRVTVRDGSGAAGSFAGLIAQHGDHAVADVTLSDRALWATLQDANGFSYTVRDAGALGGGGSQDPYSGSYYLALRTPDRATSFDGDFAATPELDGRELSQPNFGTSVTAKRVAGLTVTRKVYVPSSGYFARLLEVLENPSPSPITVDVEVSSFPMTTRVVGSSSGDATVTADDLWMVADNPYSASMPTVAHVFQGPGAANALSAVETGGRVSQTWRGVTVPAGGRVTFVHFTVQQGDQAAAQASAERLVQLPPEAIAGLTAADRATIRNFAVPLDGSSAVAPFATLAGRVLAGDGTTPVAGATVSLTTGNAIFPHQARTTASASGQFRFDTLVPGPYQAQARHPISGALSAAVSGVLAPGAASAALDLTFADTGSLQGVVRLPGGAGAGARVRALGTSLVLDGTVSTSADGGYLIAGLPAGDYVLQATAGARSASQPASVRAAQTTTADITFPAQATIQVTAVHQDGVTPLAGAQISVAAGGSALSLRGYADAAGRFTFSATEGNVIIQARGPSETGTATLTMGPGDDGQTIPVTVTARAPLRGNVQGHVTAADGVTPVSYAYVVVTDVETGQSLAAVWADENGLYQTFGVTHQGQGLRVRVDHGDVAAEATGAFTSAGETLTIDLRLALSVVKGTIFFHDGVTPVPYPGAFVTRVNADGVTETFYNQIYDPSGRYVAFGVPAGPFTVNAQDGASGLSATADGVILATDPVAIVNVLLPPTGSVAGTVVDAAGSPVPYASLGLTDEARTFTAYATADAQGQYRFERVALGSFTVQGCDGSYLCATVTGSIATPDQIVPANIVLPATGTVSGTVFGRDGSTPVAGAPVSIENPEQSGPLSSVFQTWGYTDQSGRYGAAGVPPGRLTVIAYSPFESDPTAGIAEGTLSDTATIDVTLGTGFQFGTLHLAGSDGYRYDVDCRGTLRRGGTLDGWVGPAYGWGDASHALVNGQDFCVSAGRLEEGGRQVSLGPRLLAGVLLRRTVFVPADGGFARFLEVLTNPSATARTVRLRVESSLASAASTRLVVAPTDTANTFAVTDNGDECCNAAVGHVFGGTGAAVASDATDFAAGRGTVSYGWTVTVPAGGAVALMHFAVQRGVAEAAEARAQAQALADLSDPRALVGMNATDRAQVVNFRIP